MDEKRNHTDMMTFLVMLAALVIPATIALMQVDVGRSFVIKGDPTPRGYTWSQLIFITPVALMAWWFKRDPHYHVYKKAFYATIGLFFCAGMGLDVLGGNAFFTFPNEGSHLGIHLPGYDFRSGSWVWNVPIEELSFYGVGALFMLLMYIWADIYWFGTHEPDEFKSRSAKLPKLVSAHWGAMIWGVVLIAAAAFYKASLAPAQCPFWPNDTPTGGFPGYLTVLIAGFVAPTFVFFRKVKPFINWRALSMTIFTMLLMSLIWEGTMGVPYGWWGYQCSQMVGIYISAWTYLPIEEPILWSVATWGTVMIYEVLRIHFVSGKKLRTSMLGME